LRKKKAGKLKKNREMQDQFDFMRAAVLICAPDERLPDIQPERIDRALDERLI
jgi:hypothetical protein